MILISDIKRSVAASYQLNIEALSSIVNEGIRAILNLFIFFLQEDFTRTKWI